MTRNNLKISPAGLDMIKQHEKLVLTAYMPTPNDVPTIGYGHTKGVKMGTTITEAEAYAFLREDVSWVEDAINTNVSVALNQNQFDAVASLVFNIGATAFRKSTMLRLLNLGDFSGAALQFARWNKQKGKVLRGLTKRRAEEAKLFATPVRNSVMQSTTVQASAAQMLSGVGTAVGAVSVLDGTAQLVALGLAGVVLLAAVWIMRERIKKWSNGIQ
jgi:lysozyme